MTPETPTQTIARLTKLLNELKGDSLVCPYCGHRYGAKTLDATGYADALKLHIASCQEHPMHQVLAALKNLLEAYKARIQGDSHGRSLADEIQLLRQAEAAIADFLKPARPTRAPSRAASGARKSSSRRTPSSGVERSDKQ